VSGIPEAFIRLLACAYAHECRLADLAREIVARRVPLNPGPDPDPSQARS